MAEKNHTPHNSHLLEEILERKILPVDAVPSDRERDQETLSSALSSALENVKQQLGDNLP